MTTCGASSSQLEMSKQLVAFASCKCKIKAKDIIQSNKREGKKNNKSERPISSNGVALNS